MGFDDICNTGLVLGLGFTASQDHTSPCASKPGDHIQRPNNPKKLFTTDFEPSLTLGLSGSEPSYQAVAGTKKIDVSKGCEEAIDFYRQASPHSAVSSFSSGRVKRERDLSSEEVEVEEKVSSRVSDEDEDGTNARKKLRLTKEQSALLEESFKQHSTLNPVNFSITLSLSFSCIKNRFVSFQIELSQKQRKKRETKN